METREIHRECDCEPAGSCFTEKETIALADLLYLSLSFFLPLFTSLFFYFSVSPFFLIKIVLLFILWIELCLDSEV